MEKELESPSPSRPSLFLQLRSTVRPQHTTLNRAILKCFPLCLPPQTIDPGLYAAGMSVFGQIYFAMEDTWHTILQGAERGNSIDPRHLEMLRRLQTPLLARSQRLRSDLRNLSTLHPDQARHWEKLAIVALPFMGRITDAITTNPAVLLAYAWVMYLALFNGGRWMAKELLQAGSPYWPDSNDTEETFQTYLSFWFFDDHSPIHDQKHGESVKIAFCEHFNDAAVFLNDQEQDDVIAESYKVFAQCIEMVDLLVHHSCQQQLELCGSANGISASEPQPMTIGYVGSFITPFSDLWRRLTSNLGVSSMTPGASLSIRDRLEPHN